MNPVPNFITENSFIKIFLWLQNVQILKCNYLLLCHQIFFGDIIPKVMCYILLPFLSPSILSAWIWYPPITLEIPAISAVAVNVGIGIETGSPGSLCNDTGLAFSTSPNLSLPVNNSRILPHAPLTVLWPDTWPGNGGGTKFAGITDASVRQQYPVFLYPGRPILWSSGIIFAATNYPHGLLS